MKLLFVSLGCDKNLVDSEEMLGLLTGSGFEIVDDETQAEAIVVNTCCFINDAKEESVNTILEMAEYKKSGSCKVLVVTGCMAQRYKNEIIEEVPEVDAVLGTTSYGDILKAINVAMEGEHFQEFKDIDYLLRTGKIEEEEYKEKQTEAKMMINGKTNTDDFQATYEVTKAFLRRGKEKVMIIMKLPEKILNHILNWGKNPEDFQAI